LRCETSVGMTHCSLYSNRNRMSFALNIEEMCIAESRTQWSSIHHCSQNRLGINILLQGFTWGVLHSMSSESLALNVVGESCTQCIWGVLHSVYLGSLALNAVGESCTRYLSSESLTLNLALNVVGESYTQSCTQCRRRVLHSISSESLALNFVGESCTQCRRRVLHSISIVGESIIGESIIGESYTQCIWRVLHSMSSESFTINVAD